MFKKFGYEIGGDKYLPIEKNETEERHGLIGKLAVPYPKPIRKKQERHYLSQRIVPLLLGAHSLMLFSPSNHNSSSELYAPYALSTRK